MFTFMCSTEHIHTCILCARRSVGAISQRRQYIHLCVILAFITPIYYIRLALCPFRRTKQLLLLLLPSYAAANLWCSNEYKKKKITRMHSFFRHIAPTRFRKHIIICIIIIIYHTYIFSFSFCFSRIIHVIVLWWCTCSPDTDEHIMWPVYGLQSINYPLCAIWTNTSLITGHFTRCLSYWL